MPSRGPLVRPLLCLGLACGLVLAVAGGLALRGPGVIAVGAAGVLGGCLAAGVAREHPDRDRWAMVEAGAVAAAWTVGGLLVLCGTAALVGGPATAVITATVVLVAGLIWLFRSRRAARTAASDPTGSRPSSVASQAAGGGEPAVAEVARLLPPVDQLTTRALGREWLRTTVALAGRLEPPVRASIVRRREDALDELERRDPVGFARWLAAGPVPGSDPADWLRSDATGSPEAA